MFDDDPYPRKATTQTPKKTAMPGTGSSPSSPESQIWEGRSSQWVNIVPFLLCVLIIPIPWALYRWLKIRCTKFVLTTQRLRIETGILNRHYDDTELYRVKDITLRQPFVQRLVGLGTVHLVTSDVTHPVLDLQAIKDPLIVRDIFRQQVETMRRERGVREMDIGEGSLR